MTKQILHKLHAAIETAATIQIDDLGAYRYPINLRTQVQQKSERHQRE